MVTPSQCWRVVGLEKKRTSQRKESEGCSRRMSPVSDAFIFGRALAIRTHPIAWLKSPRQTREMVPVAVGMVKEPLEKWSEPPSETALKKEISMSEEKREP
jgi:hypothetical protein